jgi:hypothetical protein
VDKNQSSDRPDLFDIFELQQIPSAIQPVEDLYDAKCSHDGCSTCGGCGHSK